MRPEQHSLPVGGANAPIRCFPTANKSHSKKKKKKETLLAQLLCAGLSFSAANQLTFTSLSVCLS